MVEVTRHQPGAFSWPELATTDDVAAKKFYGTLFGWTPIDSPGAPGMVYTRLQQGGRDVAAMYRLGPQPEGAPPHWGAYFTVTSVDDAIATTKGAGGSVLMGPYDVMEHGRMAALKDPAGAAFFVWEPRSSIGAQKIDEPGCLCWAELETTDTASAGPFYSRLFGWSLKAGGDYTEFLLGPKAIGGMMQMPKEWGPVPPHWLVYFMVEDTDQSVALARQNGGSVMVGPTDVPNVGRFAALRDPQGAVFAVFRADPAFRGGQA